MIQKEPIHLLNKTAWENVVDSFSTYRDDIEVTSLFRDFSNLFDRRSRILDLGCGTGIPFGKYIVDKGHILTGIDFSEGMIEKAKKNVLEGNFKVKSIEDIEKLDYYDGIVASYSLQLLDPDTFIRVIALCSAALKKNGIMYVSLNEPVLKRNDYTVFMGEKMFFKDYSENDLINIFAKQGLIKTDVQRSVEDSETFGKEYMIEMIFRKQ